MFDSKLIRRMTLILCITGPSAVSAEGQEQGEFFADAIDVLGSADVHRELKLAKAQVAQFQLLTDKLRKAHRRVLREAEPEGFDSISAKLRLEWERGEAEGLNSLRAHLSADQNRRLSQIWVQMRGIGALLDPVVREKLRLSAGQSEKVRDIIAQSLRPSLHENVLHSPFEDQEPKLKAARKDALAAALLVLNPDQSRIWKSIVGPPFDFSHAPKPTATVVPSRPLPYPALPFPRLPSRASLGSAGGTGDSGPSHPK